MIKSISTSPKAEIRRNSTVEYDFSQILQNIPEMHKDVNEMIEKYEKCQSLSIRRAGHICSR